MKLKYIITDYSPVIFNECINHVEAAKGLGTIHSAGFVYVSFDTDSGMFKCITFGESLTLGIKSSSDDNKKLDKMFNSLM